MNISILIPILIIIALLVSVLGSISGVGGGVLFIPAMLLLISDYYSFNQIRFVSTLLVFVSAFINVFLEFINKRFSWTLISLIAIIAIPTIFLGNYVSSLISQRITQIIVIVLLSIVTILLSCNNIISKKILLWKKDKVVKKSWYLLKTNYGLTINIFTIILITFLGGIITTLTGMGGGPILMPLLLLTCGLTMKQATPISHSVIAITAFVSLCLSYQYFSNQTLNLQISLPMTCGVVIGTIVAYFIKNKIKNEEIIKWILIVLIWISIIKMIIDVTA
ncbi:sulfite exporter TauE/SafE family protein [Spiroplasma platyhelix]|uniref:Probable membrane transporter protein n=1 Tax=Spiroplasma platyhelix PALS-1 TaxID=1276218 RepID=A0A846TVZ5_9MOLU|nr:sulfite exporter TauE/SafE family protein [Spiroplasma platyhelix]MBE4703778.1 hypothetical protein [Spiroplasma platyhelix PALS-1]NKE38151.1 sulfite exporter TauE/SafE family protein [Spiroplasma platyhelix PALS-1]UJB29036.1 hypothetical protein SPLAT_v1c02720 [Spiroplasma platyhelix PALS-1]